MCRKRLIVGAVLALSLYACGGGEPGSTSTLEPDPGPVTTAPPSAPTTTFGPDQGEAPELVGEYMVTHYYSPEFNGTTNLWPDTEITLTTRDDGTITGNAGCNDYTGTYEVAGPYITDKGFDNELGQTITLLDLSWTEVACDDELTMEQEAEFLQALQNVDRWWVGQGFGDDDNALHLLSSEDGLMVQASLSD